MAGAELVAAVHHCCSKHQQASTGRVSFCVGEGGVAGDCAQVRRGVLAILDAFPCIDLPRRFSVVRSAWGADPLTRGSYSYVTPGTSSAHIDALATPLVRAPPTGRANQSCQFLRTAEIPAWLHEAVHARHARGGIQSRGACAQVVT